MKRAYTSPAVTSRERCLVDGCTRFEELKDGRPSGGGLCSGHRYRKKHGLPLGPPLHEGLARRRSPRRALLDAALAIGEVDVSSDGDAQFRRALDRLTHAAKVYRQAVQRKAPGK